MLDDEERMAAELGEVEETGAPWALQLALNDDRQDRPTHLAVCEAAAAAVVLFLTDPRTAEPDGPWHERTQRWLAGPIRKVVRRGRGARFAAVQQLPGIELSRRGAQVRAFVPGPTDQLPPDLAKLQVGGTDQPERGEPADPVPGGLSIALTPVVAMTTGKAAAQSGHAGQLALQAMSVAEVKVWQETGWAVRVLIPDAGAWPGLVRSAGIAVHDGGFTEVPAGTRTAIAWWP
jgi:hypothetical protein